jgi:hypothetical protein
MFTLCCEIRRKSLPNLLTILQEKLAEDDFTFDGHKQKPQRKGLSDLRLNQFSQRYIYKLSARVTSYVEQGCGRTESFDILVNRTAKNPLDIEHIYADNFDFVANYFDGETDFDGWRNHIASLLLLPEDVNRSLLGKPYEEKIVHYGKRNFYAASLISDAYDH